MAKHSLVRPEKRTVDVTGARMLARTLEAHAFPPEAVAEAGEVLVRLLNDEDPKERRLAAERIRDEAGLTRLAQPTERATLHVTIAADVLELGQQYRPAPKRIEQRAPRDDGWKQG